MTHLCRGIDNGHQLFQVPRNERIVQNPVLVLHALEECVLAQGVIARAQLRVCALALLLERVYAVWEAADEPKVLALALCEGCPFVEARGGDVTLVAERDALWNVRGEADEGSCKLARQTELTS